MPVFPFSAVAIAMTDAGKSETISMARMPWQTSMLASIPGLPWIWENTSGLNAFEMIAKIAIISDSVRFRSIFPMTYYKFAARIIQVI